jgi:hypothetical protein
MARKLGANLKLLFAPGIVSSADAGRALKSDTHIAEVLALAAAIGDIALRSKLLNVLVTDHVTAQKPIEAKA